MGRRQTATINGTSASYVYDGLNVVGELNTGSTFLTGLGIDETLAMESPNGTTTPTAQIASYLTDALCSTIRLADANGNKLVDYTYDLYGNTTADAAIYNPFQYTGRENDGVDCLYYYRARYYSPCQQRFISQDPLGLGGGMNPYAYVNGNPVSFTDPFGLWSFTFGAYAGAGGQITFGVDKGTPFATVRAGFGRGGGFQFNPIGGMPAKHPENPCKGGIIIGDSIKVSGNYGPIKASGEWGVDRNLTEGESHFYKSVSDSFRFSNNWLSGIDKVTNPLWAGGVDASIGAQVTLYGKKSF